MMPLETGVQSMVAFKLAKASEIFPDIPCFLREFRANGNNSVVMEFFIAESDPSIPFNYHVFVSPDARFSSTSAIALCGEGGHEVFSTDTFDDRDGSARGQAYHVGVWSSYDYTTSDRDQMWYGSAGRKELIDQIVSHYGGLGLLVIERI